jgi:hypothetical protein
LQALWCWRQQRGETMRIEEITDEYVGLNPRERAEPDRTAAARYAEVQELQDEISKALRGAFQRHRALVTR